LPKPPTLGAVGDPVNGYSKELTALRKLVESRRPFLEENWHEHFGE